MPEILIVPSDTFGENASVFSTTGVIQATPVLAPCELGAILPSGIMGIPNKGNTSAIQSINLYDSSYNLIISVTPFTPGYYAFSPIYAYNNKFYVCKTSAGPATVGQIKTVSSTGVIGGTTWSLPLGFRVNSIAVSLDERTLYYTIGQTLKRYDLIGLASLSDLFSLTGNDSFTFDLQVLPDGSLLTGVDDTVTSPSVATVRRYDQNSGALLQTYSLGVGAADGSVPFFGINPNDRTTFWDRTFPTADGKVNNYLHIRIIDGVQLSSFTAQNIRGTGTIPFSCPLFVFGAGTPGGIYYIHPNKTNDTLYYYISGGTGSTGPVVTTGIVAIPNPYVII